MKFKYYLIVGVMLALVMSAFWVVDVYATTGCFSDTNGNWAETTICWLKDNGITTGYADGTFKPNNNVTRAEMATFLYRAGNVPPGTGELTFTFGASEWAYGMLEADVSVTPGSTLLVSRTGAVGSNTIVLSTPTLPAAIYGRKTIVAGVEICYGGDANHYLDSLTIAAGGTSVSDITNHTEANGCVSLMFPAPPYLYPRDFLTITANVRLNAAGSFAIKSTTVYLNHTADLTGP